MRAATRHTLWAGVLVVLFALGGVQAAIRLNGGATTAAAAAATVPCSQLPELQSLAARVAILGSCRWGTCASGPCGSIGPTKSNIRCQLRACPPALGHSSRQRYPSRQNTS